MKGQELKSDQLIAHVTDLQASATSILRPPPLFFSLASGRPA